MESRCERPLLRAQWLTDSNSAVRVGVDVAIEALRAAWESRTVTMDELWQATEQTRMTNVMRPYMESLV